MILQLKNVTKSYPKGESGKQVILDKLVLSVNEQESLSIVGPSGVGKSTLLNIIGGLDQADSGEVILNDKNLANLNDYELSQIRNKEIGFIFQTHYLLPQFNILENILIPTMADGHKKDKKHYMEKAKQLLDNVGLIDHINKYPAQMSVGECQRIAVVRALINGPKLLLADEPTGSLDENTASEITDLLLRINKEEKVSLITVTHSLKLANAMSRKLNLKQGKLYDRD